jgi:hypothetical protein
MSIQNIRDHIDNVAAASMGEPPRVAIVDLVAALRLLANEVELLNRHEPARPKPTYDTVIGERQ